ncbi:MAG TPA: efflux RND transporter periplasmic adaptor subunit [Myxococcota bacterium]|nr:efflux RND transporter periplasmic adaptor subunit [Myxococcota bacterium]
MRTRDFLPLLASLFAGAACHRATAPAPAAIPVQVAEVVQKDVAIQSEWIGTTEGAIDAEIRAQVSGYLISRDYQEGRVVKKNDLLFKIDPRPLQAQLDQARGDLGRATAQLEKTKQDVARFTPLAATGAVSQQELDNAVQANRAAQAAVQSARAAVEKARLNLGFAEIRSPIDGIAGVAQAQIGDLVGPSDPQPLTTVSQLDPIRVSFPLSEREYLRFQQLINASAAGKIDSAAAAKVRLQLVLADGRVYPADGHIVATGREIDQRTGTITIKGEFPNPGNALRPGQYARVRAITDVRKAALVVPQRAISELQGVQQVAVVGPDNKVQFRVVEGGPREGSMQVVEKGLNPGDKVVVEGLQKIRDGVLVEPKPLTE